MVRPSWFETTKKYQFVPNSPAFKSLVERCQQFFFVVECPPKKSLSRYYKTKKTASNRWYNMFKQIHQFNRHQSNIFPPTKSMGKENNTELSSDYVRTSIWYTGNTHMASCPVDDGRRRHRVWRKKKENVIIDIHHLPIERNGSMPQRQQVACPLPAFCADTDAGVIWSTNIKCNTHLQFLLAKLKEIMDVDDTYNVHGSCCFAIPMRRTNIFGWHIDWRRRFCFDA